MIVGILILVIVAGAIAIDRRHAYQHRQRVRRINVAYERQQAAFIRIERRLQEAIDDSSS